MIHNRTISSYDRLLISTPNLPVAINTTATNISLKDKKSQHVFVGNALGAESSLLCCNKHYYVNSHTNDGKY